MTQPECRNMDAVQTLVVIDHTCLSASFALAVYPRRQLLIIGVHTVKVLRLCMKTKHRTLLRRKPSFFAYRKWSHSTRQFNLKPYTLGYSTIRPSSVPRSREEEASPCMPHCAFSIKRVVLRSHPTTWDFLKVAQLID